MNRIIRILFAGYFAVLFYTGSIAAQDHFTVGLKVGGIATLNSQTETDLGIGAFRRGLLSSAGGLNGGLVFLFPVKRTDYVKFGAEYFEIYREVYSIDFAQTMSNFESVEYDYWGISFPLTYHKQFQTFSKSDRRRISFFIGGIAKFTINDEFLLGSSTSPLIPTTSGKLALDPGIVVGAGLVQQMKKFGAFHYELAVNYHPVRNREYALVEGDLNFVDEFSLNLVNLSVTLFPTRDPNKRNKTKFSDCPKM